MKYQASVNVALTIELEADDEDAARTIVFDAIARGSMNTLDITDTHGPSDLEAIDVEPVE